MSSTQTMTSISSSSTVQHHPLLRYVRSRHNNKQSPSVSMGGDPLSAATYFLSKPASSIHDMSSIQHTSFDFPPSSRDWYTRSPSNKYSLRIWLERKYYQYEVTWGPYVLTPGEKIFVNTMVVIMFCLIFYGFFKISIIQQAAGVIIQYIGILVREGLRTVTSLKDLVMEAAFPEEFAGEMDGGWKTVMNEITQTLSPAETGV